MSERPKINKMEEMFHNLSLGIKLTKSQKKVWRNIKRCPNVFNGERDRRKSPRTTKQQVLKEIEKKMM